MRVESIMPYNIYRANQIRRNNVQNFRTNQIAQTDSVSFQPQIAKITFTASERNMKQVASFAYENKGTGLSEDYQGGLGVVTFEAPQSMIKNEGLDVRSFGPAHEYNNPSGGYRFLFKKGLELKDGKLPEKIEAKFFVSAPFGVDREALAKELRCKPEDLEYVIQSAPDGNGPNNLSQYCIIEPTSVKDSFERMSDTKIGEVQKVEFQIFKISDRNPSYNKIKGTPNYIIWTKELAKTSKPYSYGPNGAGGIEAEINNSDFCRAYLKAERLMNTEEFGYWHPANYWGHDRPIASLFSHLANISSNGDDYFDGVRAHYTAHNPGKNYQGHTANPFEFARILFDVEDIKALRELPEYEVLESFNSRGWHNLTPQEQAFTNKCFEPFIGKFKDFFGNYNLTKVAIVAAKTNAENATFGTVSPNFDKEMKSPHMDVAAGIGGDLKDLKTISPLNGSTPANLGINNNTSKFGVDNNTLSKQRSDFTPIIYNKVGDFIKYNPNGNIEKIPAPVKYNREHIDNTVTLIKEKANNIEEVIENRVKNAKWLTGILEDAEKEGRDALNRVFFNEKQIEEGKSVFGSLSRYQDGDMLIIGWGRPDEQKGYPILYRGFLKFLQREDVPEEVKMKVKLLNGAGKDTWDRNADDFKLIQSTLKEIAEYDGGKYKHNAMYVDGLFPNKLVACATHSAFTSRREMCGITPLEAKTAGVPYLTTATGGPVDYTNEQNGWKTKTAPEMNPQRDGLDWNTDPRIINEKRIERSSNEVSDCLKAMADEYMNNKAAYIAKCKKNIEEELDWHNNSEFNGGKSANKMYRNDVWEIDKGWENRNKNPLKRLIGRKYDDAKEQISKVINELKAKLTEEIEKLTKKSEEAIENTTKTVLAKAEKSINKTMKKVEEQIIEVTNTSINEIKNTIKEIPEKNIEKSVKNTKAGKIAAFTAGIVTAGAGAGALYAYKGSNLFAKTASIPAKEEIKPAS